ncbi:MAG: hypothetical protein J6S41_04770 [Clostridia bacterium]|nr:hypothetical protein [Clostridia bacterium]
MQRPRILAAVPAVQIAPGAARLRCPARIRTAAGEHRHRRQLLELIQRTQIRQQQPRSGSHKDPGAAPQQRTGRTESRTERGNDTRPHFASTEPDRPQRAALKAAAALPAAFPQQIRNRRTVRGSWCTFVHVRARSCCEQLEPAEDLRTGSGHGAQLIQSGGSGAADPARRSPAAAGSD